jgi:recombination protein RecT
MIDEYRRDFATVLPSHIKADTWVRVAQGVMRRNDKLAAVAQRNPGSFMAALLECARLGLEIGDTYHLVPFGAEIVGIADYTGLIELAYRAGAIASIKAEIVHERDHFRYEPGEMDRPEHRPDWFADRGQMIGAYAYAVMKDGATSQVVLRSRTEIEQVQAVSKIGKAGDSPWVRWPDRMWKKTVVRELIKFIPTSTEYRREQLRAAIEADTLRHTPDQQGGAEPVEAEIVEAES